MTREDKRAYNYAKDRLANDDYPVYNDEYELELAYKAGMEDAKNHPRWISVEDELPKNKELVFITDGEVTDMGFYDYTDDAWQPFERWLGDITHWMPLPEPPKKGGEQ